MSISVEASSAVKRYRSACGAIPTVSTREVLLRSRGGHLVVGELWSIGVDRGSASSVPVLAGALLVIVLPITRKPYGYGRQRRRPDPSIEGIGRVIVPFSDRMSLDGHPASVPASSRPFDPRSSEGHVISDTRWTLRCDTWIVVRRVLFTVTGLVLIGMIFGGLVILGWMANETHFDRPSADFDKLTTQVEGLPGVSVETKDRWVEAPTFSDPISLIQLTVDEASLPGLLDIACNTEYPEPVSWSLRIQAHAGNSVSVSTATSAPSSGSSCPDFGFDVVGLVGEVDGVAGLDMGASIWDNGQFVLSGNYNEPDDPEELLPLVAHAGELRDAAGLDPSRSVEINSFALSLIIEADEHESYLALLSDLIEEHGVTSYGDGAGVILADGEVGTIHVSAPDQEHAAIEDRIRASDLRIAEFPVQFIPRPF